MKNSTKILPLLKKVCSRGGQKRSLNGGSSLKRIDLDVPLSKELCELIGAIIGDGCIDGHVNQKGKSAYHLSVTGDAKLDRNYLSNILPSIIKHLFKVKSKFYFRKDCNAMILNLYSKKVFTILTKRFGLVAGNKTYIVKIPDEILNSDEKFIFATIRGIFDTDGNVFIDKRKICRKPYGRITLRVVSEPLHNQLKEFIEKYFSLYVAVKKDNNGLSDSLKYEITVYGNAQIKKWMHLIGFSNERHLGKIRELFKLWEGFEPSICCLQGSRLTTRPPEHRHLIIN